MDASALDSITDVPSVFRRALGAFCRAAKVQLGLNERQRMLCDHQSLVGGDDPHAAVRCGARFRRQHLSACSSSITPNHAGLAHSAKRREWGSSMVTVEGQCVLTNQI